MKLKDKVFGLGQSLLGGVALALIVGCSASPTTPEISHDGLVLQDDTKFGLVYAKPGVDIRDYEIVNGDRILITFGGETDNQIQKYLTQLDNQEIIS